MPWVRRSRSEPPLEPAPDGPSAEPTSLSEPPVREQRIPSTASMRRERRALSRWREIEIRDVGGLTVEMVRRDRFNPDLLVRRANDVLSLEQRLHELDALLMASVAARRGLGGAVQCRCGAPILPGAHFCSHCGRPAPGAPAVSTCGRCGQPLPADANFCASCGNSIAAEEYQALDETIDETMVRRWSPGEERIGEP